MASIRLDGLVSGLDTTSIIDSLVAASGANYNLLTRNKSNIELRKSHWQTFNGHLNDLKTAIEAMSDPDEFKKMAVSSADDDRVTASVSGTALAGTYSVEVSQLASSQTTKSTTSWASGSTAFTAGTAQLTFNVNGGSASVVTLTTNTLDGAISAINDNGLGIHAYKVQESSGNYRLVLTGENTGADYDFTITRPGDMVDVAFEAVNTSEAQDTLAEINGISVKSSNREISEAIPGVTLSILDETASPVEITVTTDTAGLKSNIQAFIAKYNTVMSYITYELKVNSNTQEAGPLASDNTLKSIQRTLQALVREEYTENDVNTLGILGINTKADGTLEIDTDDLDDMLDENFSEVISLFTDTDGLFQAFTNVSDEGGLDILLNSSDGTVSKKIDTLDDQIEDLDERIEKEDSRLEKLEAILRQKFSAMEVLLSSLKNTESYVTNVLGKLGNNNKK